MSSACSCQGHVCCSTPAAAKRALRAGVGFLAILWVVFTELVVGPLSHLVRDTRQFVTRPGRRGQAAQ